VLTEEQQAITGAPGPVATPTNGHITLSQDQPLASRYLAYLPAPFQGDPFLARFLLIFETILDSVERSIDNVAYAFDPRLAPAELLPWLASWVGLELDENWPLPQQRQLILWAATLYRWRGTRRGLREHLRLYTGRTPLIVEGFDGMRVGQDAVLGLNTTIGGATPRQHWITVTVLSDQPENLDERILRQIIEIEKPAHVGYTLEIRRPDAAASGTAHTDPGVGGQS
jgi:phage tail-like protein